MLFPNSVMADLQNTFKWAPQKSSRKDILMQASKNTHYTFQQTRIKNVESWSDAEVRNLQHDFYL